MPKKEYASFNAFFDFYISQHQNTTCRRLHVIGTLSGLLLALCALATAQWWLIPVSIVVGYAFAWVGHGLFERNRPATFQYPLYSFMGDWLMLYQCLTGQRRF